MSKKSYVSSRNAAFSCKTIALPKRSICSQNYCVPLIKFPCTRTTSALSKKYCFSSKSLCLLTKFWHYPQKMCIISQNNCIIKKYRVSYTCMTEINTQDVFQRWPLSNTTLLKRTFSHFHFVSLTRLEHFP